MSSSSSRSPRQLGLSQSFYPSASSSRPFLNMLNPLTRQHQGYMQANQVVREEEDLDDDVESGQRDIPLSRSSRRKISWDEPPVLHPNIHQDKIDGPESSDDDEVPQSFMVETARSPKDKGKARDVSGQTSHSTSRKLPPVLPTHVPVSAPPRPADIDDENEEDTPRVNYQSERQPKAMRGLDDYERALWNWVNVYNLDAFLQEVYYYYEGKGIYSIALARGLNLLTVGFVIGFSTFLLGCIDYGKIHPDKSMRLSDAIVGSCVSRFSGFTFMFFVLFTTFYLWEIVSYVLSVRRLVDMYKFYTHLLKIPDEDIQTISWPEIVRRIGSIREENPLTAISSANTNDIASAKLDAHDIANRILRQENYLIALFNKDLLDLRVPLPRVLKRFISAEEGKGRMLTQALEWNIRFCLMEYLFDSHGKVRRVFLKSKNRKPLIEGLKRRFIFMGILNAIFAPFIVLYLLMYSFFRYFEEYHKNPSTISGRRYTSFAQWKFREFNELPHLFVRRLDESVQCANMFIGQFPNEKLTLLMRFVGFISGSFAAVLFLATVLDTDILSHLEITPHRTVLFYLGVFTSIMTIARGMIPEENRVYDPEELITIIITYTHYMPDSWKGLLHSKKVHQEFGELFQMKILIFVQELLSVVLTPFVLWFSLPECAPAIVDFFREFSVHVDGRGYVCSFAEFNFERHGNVKFGAPAPTGNRVDKRMISNDGKMEKSFLTFKAANPDWNPIDPSGSLYLSRIADYTASQHRRRPPAPGLEGTVLLDRRPESSTLAYEYDRALKQSQTAARRRGAGSTAGLASSVFAGGGMSMAQTAVLGDSQGSVNNINMQRVQKPMQISEEDLDGIGSNSGLGGSYVDGAKRARAEDFNDADAEETLEDEGVLGLLTQIYGRRDGPVRRL